MNFLTNIDLNASFDDNTDETSSNINIDEYFIKIIRYLPNIIKNGCPEHFIITGNNRNIISFLIRNISVIIEKDLHMGVIQIKNSETSSTEELMLNIIEKLHDECCCNNFCDGYLKRISQINKTEFTLKTQKSLINNIKRNFSKLLLEICENFENKPIFIIIDDINGLSDNLKFTNGYKILFESIQFNKYYMPLVFILICSSKEFDNFCLLNESFTRIFHLIKMDN